MRRAIARLVSNMKPMLAIRLNSRSAMSGVPGGAVGCTRTGSARRSISAHTGANSGSVRARPAMLASTITPDRAPVRGSRQLRHGGVRILPGERAQPADARGVRGLGSRHVVVDDPRRLEAHVAAAPVHVRAREGDDREIDARGVHLADAVRVVEVPRLGRHERRAVEKDALGRVQALPELVAGPAVGPQELEPVPVEHVGVDVDSGGHARSSVSGSPASRNPRGDGRLTASTSPVSNDVVDRRSTGETRTESLVKRQASDSECRKRGQYPSAMAGDHEPEEIVEVPDPRATAPLGAPVAGDDLLLLAGDGHARESFALESLSHPGEEGSPSPPSPRRPASAASGFLVAVGRGRSVQVASSRHAGRHRVAEPSSCRKRPAVGPLGRLRMRGPGKVVGHFPRLIPMRRGPLRRLPNPGEIVAP